MDIISSFISCMSCFVNTLMVTRTKVIGYSIIALTVWLGFKMHGMFKVPPLPMVPRDHYWGPGKEPASQDTSIRPFKIQFTPDMVSDLKERLNRTRYTTPLEHVGFEYGFNHDALKAVVDFWQNNYDFESREKYMNQFPHFKTIIQGLDMHFIHIKPDVPEGVKVLPLLMCHGWPGSIREFYKIIPMLTTPQKDSEIVFELVVPSLPGFGFSQAASKTGLGAVQVGAVMANLMERLGHKQFYVQGGDWGSIIASAMATLYPDTVLGYHTNFPSVSSMRSNIRTVIGSLWPSMFVNSEFVHKVYPLRRRLEELLKETGYFHIQATKPDTVGLGIGDSPAGLAAYILEKFSTATNPAWRKLDDGGLTKKFTYTDLIDNLMVYWVSNSATTAVRLYAESLCKAAIAMKIDSIPTTVPTAAAKFPNEISYVTDAQLMDKYPNLLQSTEMPRGGHFAAFEEPELLSQDIISAVKKFQEFHKNKK